MSLQIECLSPLLSCGLWGIGLIYKASFYKLQVWKGDFNLQKFSFSWFLPVCLVVLKVVLHLGNGKREYLQGAFPLKICKELVGPSSIYFHVITCLTCLPLIADSCLLCSSSDFLCACVICRVKFGYVFHVKFFKSLTCPRLSISLVACLSCGTDGVWTLLFQEGVYLRVAFCCSLIGGMFFNSVWKIPSSEQLST